MTPTAQQRSAIYSALILESASLATGEPERRLSSDQSFGAGVRHAPGSDASDGTGKAGAEAYGSLLVDQVPEASTPSLWEVALALALFVGSGLFLGWCGTI